MPETYIIVKFEFAGWHRWPDAPMEYQYLSFNHRHMFHVEAGKLVSHSNREIEIIDLKGRMESFCRHNWGRQPAAGENAWSHSCEDMAAALCQQFKMDWCCVLEDGENGAVHYPTNALGPRDKNPPKKYNPEEPIEEEAWDDADTGTSNFQFVSGKKPMLKTEFPPVVAPRGRGASSLPNTEPVRRFPGTMFWGTEAEGPHRGRRTLFVPGDVEFLVMNSFLKSLRERPKWDDLNLYLGADNRYFYSKEINFWVKRHLGMLAGTFSFVWVECMAQGFNEANMVENPQVGYVMINDSEVEDEELHADFVKEVHPDHVTWKELHTEQGMNYLTKLDDPLFAKDVAVERR